jgi:hypothetical protein
MDRRSFPAAVACLVVTAGALWGAAGGCGDDDGAGPGSPGATTAASFPPPTPLGEYEPSTPESFAVAGAETAATDAARADPDDEFDESAAGWMNTDGYVVEIQEPGLRIAVLVDRETATVTPIGQTSLVDAYGWGPVGTPRQIDGRPAGEAERWATDAAETVVMAWLDGVPGMQDRTFEHKGVVRYAVSPAGYEDVVYLVTPAGRVVGSSGP